MLAKVLEVSGFVPWVLPHLQIKYEQYFMSSNTGFLDLNRSVRRAAVIGRVRNWFHDNRAKNPQTAMLMVCNSVLQYTHELFQIWGLTNEKINTSLQQQQKKKADKVTCPTTKQLETRNGG